MATAVNGDCCVSLMKGTLVLPVARYPASVVTDDSLKIAANQIETTLVGKVGSGDVIFRVSDASRLVANMLLSIDSEIVNVSAIDYTASTVNVVRGFDGTVPCPHNPGRALKANIDAWHHNSLAAEVKAIEAALGANLANVGGPGGASPGVMATAYDFTPQSPGGSLVVGANSITLSPVPQGVNGNDVEHYLYVSGGTGTAEAVKIIGGPGTANAPSGTIIIQCANTHSGAWTIRSATAGVAEAICANASAVGYFDVKLPNGTVNFYAPAYSSPNTPSITTPGMTISGQGERSTKINMYADTPVFRFVGVYYPTVRNLEIQYWVTGSSNTIEFTDCPVAMVSDVASTGPSGISFVGCSGMTLKNSYVNVQATTGKGIYARSGTGAETGWFSNNFINSFTSSGRAAVGLELVHGTGIIVSGNHFINFDVNVNMSPSIPIASGGYVGGNKFFGNFFDRGGFGVQIVPTNGAYVERTVFTGNWFNSAEVNGLRILGTGGTVRQLNFTGNEFMLCGQDGVNAQDASNLVFTGNSFGNNSVSAVRTYRGMLLAGVTKATVCGNQFGPIDAATHTVDLLLGGGVDQIVVTGNSFRGWMDGPINDGSTGQDKTIGNNDGLSGLIIPVNTDTAGGTLNPQGYDAEILDVSGTAAITAISGGWKNRKVTLIRTAAGSVTVMGKTLAQGGRLDGSYNAGQWWFVS